MFHTFINVSHLQKFNTLKKCVTLSKMCHTYNNVSQLQKCVTITNMCHTFKNVSHFQKCLTITTVSLLKNTSHF